MFPVYSKKYGFTIVELLVIIVLISILSAIIVVPYIGINQRATSASLQSDLVGSVRQLKLFNVDNSIYPNSISDCPSPAVGNMCLKSSPGNSYTLYRVSNSSPPTFCIEEVNGTNIYSVSDSLAPTTTQICRWYSGLASTALVGKTVYYQDIPTMYLSWATFPYSLGTACPVASDGSKPCKVGLDPSYPSNSALVSPQTYPNVDFSSFPAQNACKAVGGRLPYTQEILAIIAGKTSYGNNFNNSVYFTATEYSGWNMVAWNYGIISNNKYNQYGIRCVKD